MLRRLVPKRSASPFKGAPNFGILRSIQCLIGSESNVSDVASTRSNGPSVVTTHYLDQEV